MNDNDLAATPSLVSVLVDSLADMRARHGTDLAAINSHLEKIMADIAALNTALGQFDQVVSAFAGLVQQLQGTIAELTAAQSNADQPGIDIATTALQQHLVSAQAVLAGFQTVQTATTTAAAADAGATAPVTTAASATVVDTSAGPPADPTISTVGGDAPAPLDVPSGADMPAPATGDGTVATPVLEQDPGQPATG